MRLSDRPAPAHPVLLITSAATTAADLSEGRAAWPVALVSMPFASMIRPSMQLGLLKAIAEAHGFPTDTFHLNLDFGARIGAPLYELLCENRRLAVGDWLFSKAAFGSAAPDPDDRFVERFHEHLKTTLGEVGSSVERLLEIRREEVPAYLEALMTDIPWDRFRVVGFTSTFHQNGASLALASAIKDRFPDIVILFGGANFDGDMGVEFVRSLTTIDYAVCGEADEAFPQFLAALAEGRDPCQVPGVAGRRAGTVAPPAPGQPFDRLDDLPVPDYAEYFERAERLGLLKPSGRREVPLPFETSRGCWWGAQRHCTFCGLNGASMAFRRKSPARVESELADLTRRYRSFDFQCVDNIMDTDYLDTLFPRLTRAGVNYRLFYEVKSSLTPDELRTMREGGVRWIQPGIESLSSHVLALMRKGVRASQNVNLLRWASYYRIQVAWNILWGFPGETEDDYGQQADLMRNLTHLTPPASADRIWMERFSPIFADREAFPAAWVRPEESYAYVYPSDVDMEKAGYFFEYQLDGTLPNAAYDETREVIKAWNEAWLAKVRPTLSMWSAPEFLQIDDRRNRERTGTYTFADPLASIYRACSDRPRTAPEVRTMTGVRHPAAEVESALDEFVTRGLMMRDGNLFLSLAVPFTGGIPGHPSK